MQKNEAKSYYQDVWNILILSYKELEGLKSYQSVNHLYKSTDLYKIVFDRNQVIIACATYRFFARGTLGRKMTAIGCDQTREGKEALRDIIKSDIKEYDLHYWVEASGPIERLFRKYDGYPMSGFIASKILQKDVELCEDGVHYNRIIGTDDIPTRKMIFGIPNKEIFDEVTKILEDYASWKDKFNNLTESTENVILVDTCKLIDSMFDMWSQEGFREILPEWKTALNKSISILNMNLAKYNPQDNSVLETYLADAKYFRDLPLLELHELIL